MCQNMLTIYSVLVSTSIKVLLPMVHLLCSLCLFLAMLIKWYMSDLATQAMPINSIYLIVVSSFSLMSDYLMNDIAILTLLVTILISICYIYHIYYTILLLLLYLHYVLLLLFLCYLCYVCCSHIQY